MNRGTRSAGAAGVTRGAAPALAAMVVLAGAAACAGGRGGAEAGEIEPVCHEGAVRVTGTEPFFDVAVVADGGSRLVIDREATEISALSGATVRLCVTADPVGAATDITEFDLIGVEDVDAVLGTVEGDRLRRASTGRTMLIRASADALNDVAEGCVWIAGPIASDAEDAARVGAEDGTVSLWSWGSVPAGVCALAAAGPA